MNRGYVIIAHNNSYVDYCAIALCNALMIKANSVVQSVTLITDTSSEDWFRQQYPKKLIGYAFDKIILVDRDEMMNPQPRRLNDTASTQYTVDWHNNTRHHIYDLSPYDETILLDADYLVFDTSLDLAWGSNEDVLINRRAVPVDHGKLDASHIYLDSMSVPMYWATLIYFQKTKRAKLLFDTVAAIKDNYLYFQQIWGYPGVLYRNDYAFSVAIHMLNGFVESDDFKPFPVPTIFTSFDYDELIDVPAKNELLLLVSHNRSQFVVSRIKKINVHVMNKMSIVRQAPKILKFYAPKELYDATDI
jgi:hypothetical protein